MMRLRTLSGVSFGCLLLALCLPLAGCRRTAAHAPEPSPVLSAKATEDAAVATAGAHGPDYYNAMTDEAVALHQQSMGLALGLKIPAATYKAGDPIPFHILIEDVGASEPIAAGLCSGVRLAYQNLTDPTEGAADIDNRSCFATIPNPDETALDKGRLKEMVVTQRQASYLNLTPGDYLFNISWSPYRAGRLTVGERLPYTTLASNVIRVTILPGPDRTPGVGHLAPMN